MPAPIWPLDLPQKPFGGDKYALKIPNQQLRSQMQSGPDKVRPEGNAKPFVDSVFYVGTFQQACLFIDFATKTLKGGTICFDWPHPTFKRYVRARMVAASDNLANVQPWGKTQYWQIPLTVEYWPDAVIA